MILVQAVFFGAGHLAPEYRQLRRRLSAFLHPGNAGSLFFSRSPPKNLEGIMSAAEMGSDERHSPVGGEGKVGERQPDSPVRWYFFRGHWLMLWSCQRRRREKATEYRNNLLCEKRKQPTVTLQILLR